MRRFFLRRLLLLLLALFAVVFGASALAVALFFGASGRRGSIPAALVGGTILLALTLFGLARTIRRMAAPIGDVMEAADRFAAGDHTARVDPRGPREVRSLGRAFNAMAERLQANEEQRRNLLADVTHELRTPLSVIRGNAEGLVDGLYPADEAHLAPIVEETDVMARLLDDLSLLSTAEAGTLSLYREPVAPADLVGEAVGAFRAAADEAGVRLDGRAAEDLPELDVDPVRIREVLSNLIGNALHHTPAGGAVTVTAVAGEAAGRPVVEFRVIDTGSGIAADELSFVFERFRKSAGSGGAGLGLAISRYLVEAHGGTIDAESELGRGTTIRFALPVGP
jgi:two-component system sensor histidine kinase BaeS